MANLSHETLALSPWLRRAAGLNWRRRWLSERVSHGVQAAIEPQESRDYCTGDDLTRVDWNRCARLDELVVRQYFGNELRSLDVWIDHSPSMEVDGGDKLAWARRFAAFLALQAIDEGETVSLFRVATKVEQLGDRVRGRSQLCRILPALEQSQPMTEGLRLADSARAYLAARRGDATLLILSDIFEFESSQFVEAFRLFAAAGVQVCLLQLHTQAEVAPSAPGRFALQDVEGGASLSLTLRDDDLQAYRREVAAYMQSVRRVCHRAGALWARVPVDTSLDEVVRVLSATSRLGRT